MTNVSFVGEVKPKMKIDLLTIMSFQICMTFFILCKIKKIFAGRFIMT